MTTERRVLILGGYGAVGREAATALVQLLPGATVITAGRNPSTTRHIHGTVAMRVDAADENSLIGALAGVDTVLMCVELNHVRVARACLERGIHYLDVSATHRLLARIEDLDGLARQHGATAALSVGLAPGVTNLLAKRCVRRGAAGDIEIGVLLGSGERHGPAAVRWTIDGLGRLSGSWQVRFPAPYGRRTVYRFPISDQFTLLGTLGVPQVRTGLCLDSRLITAFLAAGRRPAVARLLRRPRARDALVAVLTRVHLGGDGFAVAVSSGDISARFSGRRQSRATGLVAALLVARLPTLPAGVWHIEQLVDPVDFLTELAGYGFQLDLDTRRSD